MANILKAEEKQSNFSLWKPSNQALFAYLLMLPAILITLVIIAYPIISAIDLSFQDIKITQVGRERFPWTLDNYVNLFTSSEFWVATWVTLKLVVIVTFGSFVLGLGTAMLVNQHFRGRTLARILVALPWAVPAVMAAVVWWWMFDSSFGLVNWLLVKAGIISAPVAWFSQPTSAFIVICVVMMWKGYPFVSVMLLAGLQAIPGDIYEAAHIDGAGKWSRFRHITLPSLSPVMGIALILVILWVFRDFPIIWILTGGGPIGSTRTLAIMTYEQAFGFYNMGYAATIGMITLVISLVASVFMIRRLSASI